MLKAKGLKVTNQRLIVLKVLDKHRDIHMAAEDIYKLVKAECPDIGLATVYRTVQLLLEMQLINQFLAYLGLAEAGVGTASVVALYAPLANNNTKEVNGVLSAARRFYNRSGMLFLGLVGVLTVVYPFMISGQLDNTLVRSMILVLASSTLVDYFFLGKYRVLLTANQEGYIVALIQSAGTLVNMVLSIALIYQGANVLWVKAVATGVYMLRLFLVKRYAKKRYPELDFHVEPSTSALTQRGAALLHQVVGIIVNNTDVVLLTILLGKGSLLEVSVYGVYN